MSKEHTDEIRLLELGKLVPQAIDLEEAVLGALMLDANCLDRIVPILTADAFYKEAHSHIFSAIHSLYLKSYPVDILTVIQELKSSNKLEIAGNALYITQLTNRVASSANVEMHARIVLEKYLQRELIRSCTSSLEDAYEENCEIFDLYSSTMKKIDDIMKSVSHYEVSSVNDIHRDNVKESLIVAEQGHSSGVETGLRSLDKLTNGWQKTDLIIIAGRPGMGKSALAVSMSIFPAIQRKEAVAIFSLEMSKSQLVGRIESILSGIDVSKIIKKQLTYDEIVKMDNSCAELKKAPIFIDDTPNLSLADLKSKARRLVKDQNIKLIVIDYLQLMRSGMNKFSREQEVSEISKGLKNLAKELDIPIIALSQLSRLVESRADKKPMLSDLRESGSIEQDADMVLFCYRPEHYAIDSYELGSETYSSKGLFLLLISKHRNGVIGDVALSFIAEQTLVTNHTTYQQIIDAEEKSNTPKGIKADEEVGS